MGKVYLLFAIHSHQPVGNFEHVFAKAVRECYGPFIEMLEEHPRFRLSLHYSGPLLEWIEAHQPSIIERLRRLIGRGQVEIMGGGFYEPLLSSIPRSDAVGQLEMMNEYCLRTFAVRPRGLWLTERVWDPAFPLQLEGSGLRFTVVDDTHLLYAGLTEKDIRGYYVTEREGKALAVFPTHMRLRYLIPFRPVDQTMEFLRRQAAGEPEVALTYGDDGEKFGVWPGTRKWVFEDGWLARFMAAIEAADWIEMMPLGEYLERFPPRGRIYMPTASYEEMTEWALPVEAQLRYQDMVAELERLGRRAQWQPFIRAGIWDNFLVKYPEANLMHKRMLWTSNRVAAAGEQARRELYRGQCNCAYWHGLFGGLYLKHLRQAVYYHLIQADRLAEADRPTGWCEVERCDYDRDGQEEVVVTNAELFACLAPAAGGSLLELDYKPRAVNVTDTLTRRQEAYHRKLKGRNRPMQAAQAKVLSIHELTAAKEEGLEKLLIYDPYERRSFLDHFLSGDATLGTVGRGHLPEEGDFVGAPYRLAGHEVRGGEAVVRLERSGKLGRDGAALPVKIAKTFSFSGGASLRVDYHLSAERAETEEVPLRFAVELNLSPVGDGDPKTYVLADGERHPAGEAVEVAGPASQLVLVDERLDYRIEISPEPQADSLWLWPLETVSQSDEGFERNRQGTVLLISWRGKLRPGDDQGFAVRLRLAPAL